MFHEGFAAPLDIEIIGRSSWNAGFTLVADQFQRGRILLGGDAVHLFTPTGGLGYNTAALIGPQGYIGKYRKHGLNAQDQRWVAVGNLGFPVFDTELGRISMLICYDDTYWQYARLAALQTDILVRAASLVRVGGVLGYAVCSPTHAEGREVAEGLARHGALG